MTHSAQRRDEEFLKIIRNATKAGMKDSEIHHGELPRKSSVEKRVAGTLFSTIRSFFDSEVEAERERVIRIINKGLMEQSSPIRVREDDAKNLYIS